MKIEIYKNRSYYACLHDAGKLLFKDINSILKKTWIVALVFSIIATIDIFFIIPNKGLHDWGLENPVASWIIQTVVYLLSLTATLVLFATTFNYINNSKLKSNLIKTIKVSAAFFGIILIAMLVIYCINYACNIIAGQDATWLKTLFLVIQTIIASILTIGIFIPISYVFPRYMIDENATLKCLPIYFKTGLRHFGKLFVTSLILGIIIVLALIIVLAPSIILFFAQTTSQLGALNGDDLGMPGYFGILLTLSSIISFLIISYISVLYNFVFTLICGSIETLEMEKQQIDYETKKNTLH